MMITNFARPGTVQKAKNFIIEWVEEEQNKQEGEKQEHDGGSSDHDRHALVGNHVRNDDWKETG